MSSFEISKTFSVSAQRLYDAWLDGKQHSEMTGGEANGKPQEGAEFSAWDGYIWGSNIELESGKYIKQSWRTTEFANDDEDSIVEIEFDEDSDGTTLRLRHSNIPDNQPDYEAGWDEHYFLPMESYFND